MASVPFIMAVKGFKALMEAGVSDRQHLTLLVTVHLQTSTMTMATTLAADTQHAAQHWLPMYSGRCINSLYGEPFAVHGPLVARLSDTSLKTFPDWHCSISMQLSCCVSAPTPQLSTLTANAHVVHEPSLTCALPNCALPWHAMLPALPQDDGLVHAEMVFGFYLAGGVQTLPDGTANFWYVAPASGGCASQLLALLTSGCQGADMKQIWALAKVVAKLIEKIYTSTAPDLGLGNCVADIPAVLVSLFTTTCPSQGYLFNPLLGTTDTKANKVCTYVVSGCM